MVMGMYTELRGQIKFKTDEIAELFSEGDDHWKQIGEILGEKVVTDFQDFSRSHWIPNGGTECKEGGIVSFSTELKNYDGTIGKFLTDILPLVADDWVLEERYEERSQWTLHRKDCEPMLVNGDNTDERDASVYSGKAWELTEFPNVDVFDPKALI
jgi:hypothetical protein